MIVYLARHGTHDEVGRVLSGRSGIALNDAGQAEATCLSERLARVPLAAVHSSPRPRAIATAAPAAERHGLPVRMVEALDEIDFGDWTGRPFDELGGDPRWTRWNAARHEAATPAGETMAAVVARVRGHLTELTDGPVLCVSHCDVIRGLVADAEGLAPDRFFTVDIDPGSLTTVEIADGAIRILQVNERPQ